MTANARLLMALKIWMVISPSITFFYFLFGQRLATLPLYQRTFILTISLVPLMMFIGVPFIDFLLRWLKRDAPKQKWIVTNVQGNAAMTCFYKGSRNCT